MLLPLARISQMTSPASACDLCQALEHRGLALPKSIRQWSLTTLREKLIKIGAKVTRHSKYVFFQLAEVAVPRQLFAALLERIGRLAMQPAVCRSG